MDKEKFKELVIEDIETLQKIYDSKDEMYIPNSKSSNYRLYVNNGIFFNIIIDYEWSFIQLKVDVFNLLNNYSTITSVSELDISTDKNNNIITEMKSRNILNKEKVEDYINSQLYKYRDIFGTEKHYLNLEDSMCFEENVIGINEDISFDTDNINSSEDFSNYLKEVKEKIFNIVDKFDIIFENEGL